MLKKNLILVLLLTIAIVNVAAQRPKVGLVLGGGGAKGFAHIAVLELIEEMGIPVDLVIGVSAGAIVGGLYSVGYSPEMLKDTFLDLDWADLFIDTPVSPFTNEFGARDLLIQFNMEALSKGVSPGQMPYFLLKKLTAKIPSYIDFDTLPIPFRAGVVEIPEGRVELIKEGDLAEAMRASMGIPGIFDPFDIDGKIYIDGGTLNNLPIQLAKEMGCDIIIASELFPDIENISVSPRDVAGFMLGLYFNFASREQYHLADVVLKLPVQKYTMMDFTKSREIYSAASGEKESMRSELKKIQELLSSFEPEPSAGAAEKSRPIYRDAPPVFEWTGSPGLGFYRDLPDLTPVFLNITGALPRDKEYIENYYYEIIHEKPLEQASFSDFMRRVFNIGNYRFTAIRIDTRQGQTGLELLLSQKNYKETVFLLGEDFLGTFSRSSFSELSVQGGVQFWGLTGPGSVLSFDASVGYVFSFGILYLQPLSRVSFLTAHTEIKLDREITFSSFSLNDPVEKRLFLVSGEVKGGKLIDQNRVFKAGLLFFASDLHDPPTGENVRNKALGFGAELTYNDMNYISLPTIGAYANLENRFYATLPNSGKQVFDLFSLDLQKVMPLSRRLSVALGGFAGFDLSLNLSRIEELPVGFTAFDRQYFPNICSTNAYYSHKVAGSLAFQFQPWKNFPILGEQAVLSVSASAGELFDEFQDFEFYKLMWNASFNIGFRIRKNYQFLIRIGAGSNGNESPAFFMAFDIGQVVRSGIKPRN